MALSPFVVGTLLIGVLGAGVYGVMWFRETFFRDHFRDAPVDGNDGCAACGHSDVLELAPGAYLCPSCGYEGGPNLARVQWLAEMATLKERPLEQQQEVRRTALEEGRLLVGVAEGELQRAAAYRDKADTIRPTTKEARAHINELRALADQADGQAIAPTLEAMSQLETVEFLSTGDSSLQAPREAIVDATSSHAERAAVLVGLAQLRAILASA